MDVYVMCKCVTKLAIRCAVLQPEPRGNHWKRFKDFCLEAMAKMGS